VTTDSFDQAALWLIMSAVSGAVIVWLVRAGRLLGGDGTYWTRVGVFAAFSLAISFEAWRTTSILLLS
jgi:hypothetical protein